MGWGTFIAGRASNAWNRSTRNQSSISEAIVGAADELIRRETVLETEVLKEIKRLKSEGKDIDINVIREVTSQRIKRYNRLGPRLELEIIKESQRKALAGEEENYEQIEREILDRPKNNSPWVTFMLWWFFPYIMLPRQIFKNMSLNKDIDRKFGLRKNYSP